MLIICIKHNNSEIKNETYNIKVTPKSQDGNEYYITVALNSGKNMIDFQRKRLNLVIVLDISGSMDSPFDENVYSLSNNKVYSSNNHDIMFVSPNELIKTWKHKSKLEIAKESIIHLLGKLY